MQKEFDVIIIGAGPAGLECANQLKNSNLSVLVIEKNKVIGPKICAGGLTNATNSFNFPPGKIRVFKDQIIRIDKKEYKITLTNPLKTISRYDLGQYQLNLIKHANNIRILNGTRVAAIKNNKVFTNNGDFYFKNLVGADGSNSTVRKYLGLKSKMGTGLYLNTHKITDKFIWEVAPQLLKSGYLWIFPHLDHTNIGIYFNPEYLSSNKAKEILINHLKESKFEFAESELKGATISYFYQGFMFNNIYLIGDAAGLASKATGEGISFALISGSEIGEKIINPAYKMREFNKILRIKKRQEKMLKIFEAFPFLQILFFKIFVRLMNFNWFQLYFGN